MSPFALELATSPYPVPTPTAGKKTTDDYFGGKRVILFSLPGAFTPTCSTFQLRDFESRYDEFQKRGIDEIYCLSVNGSFVMNAWAKAQGLKKSTSIRRTGNGKNPFLDLTPNDGEASGDVSSTVLDDPNIGVRENNVDGPARTDMPELSSPWQSTRDTGNLPPGERPLAR
ncbi:thioredoxin-like protein (plasmid) [Rhizobium etli bv. mimosae str. IE4771]|uniref:Thioredoxin-like protein n=1 Tax=Rhizobium etli bv. mimosae str. IE4771 TaxID=1432050 RepID=A0A060ICY3_RHIET|nr:thioredoxin-like protein [Rhizobium sp. IE4771]